MARAAPSRLRAWLAEHATGETALTGLAAAVGLATGLLAVALIAGVDLVQQAAFGLAEPLAEVPRWALPVVPAAGGLAVGLIAHRVLPSAAGGGLTPTLASLILRDGRMSRRTVPVKLVATVLSLGTGASGGREGPMVQVGAAAGSALGQATGQGGERLRSLVAAGAAGGIAASFNAPIGGMLFAMEVVIGRFSARHLHTVVVSAVIASVTARQLVGDELIWQPPAYGLEAPWQLGAYLLVGLAAVPVGIALVRGIDLVEQASQRLRRLGPLRTALGGLAVGLVAVAVPEVLGAGTGNPAVAGADPEPVARLLEGQVGVLAALALLAAKLLATALALGTGSSVGAVGPALMLGACLGAAAGHGVDLLAAEVGWLETGMQPGATALAGAAAVLAAAGRAPLTGILIVFELTGSYDMVLPLMLAVGVAAFTAERVHPRSLTSLPLARMGLPSRTAEPTDLLETVTVAEVMTREPETVPADLPAPDLRRLLRRHHLHGVPVVDADERLVGVVTLSDIDTMPDHGQTGDLMSMSDEAREATAGQLATTDVLTATPEEPVGRALQRMAAAQVGRLPVVASGDARRLIGLLDRGDVIAAYRRARSRRAGERDLRDRARLGEMTDARPVELTVRAGAPVDGREVREVDWPEGVVLASARRGPDRVAPTGSTRLRAGDHVVAMCPPDRVGHLRALVGDAPVDPPD